MTSTEPRLWSTAIACFAVVLVLGWFVVTRQPTAIDVLGGGARGVAVQLAAFFTLLGRWYVLTGIALVACAVAYALRADVRVVIALFVAQVLGQGANAVMKELYHRARPPHWLLFHELDFSYPSGHSVTAITFYLALLLLVVRSHIFPRPYAVAIGTVLATCVVGIPWSRLALGAHWVTDVIGGLVFGCGWLCATIAFVQRVATSSRISP